MQLLDFARGPALAFALVVFVIGTLWRLVHALTRPRLSDLSAARAGTPPGWVGALRAVLRGLWPRPEFRQRTRTATLNGYVFHLGLALVVFGYAPHIAFVRRLTGLGWPALPDAVIYLAAAATLLSALMAIVVRLSDPVLSLLSNADDWVTWTLILLPLATGMAVASEPSAAIVARDNVLYATPLAVHLLSLELLLVWFPFGKLMHAFLFAFSRAATGMRFGHRGVNV